MWKVWRCSRSRVSQPASRRVDERIEQPAELAGPPEVFRMPLDADAEPRIRSLNRFNYTVWCGRRRDEFPAERADRLMVAAVHPAGAPGFDHAAERRMQSGLRGDLNVVSDAILRHFEAMRQIARPSRRD